MVLQETEVSSTVAVENDTTKGGGLLPETKLSHPQQKLINAFTSLGMNVDFYVIFVAFIVFTRSCETGSLQLSVPVPGPTTECLIQAPRERGC